MNDRSGSIMMWGRKLVRTDEMELAEEWKELDTEKKILRLEQKIDRKGRLSLSRKKRPAM